MTDDEHFIGGPAMRSNAGGWGTAGRADAIAEQLADAGERLASRYYRLAEVQLIESFEDLAARLQQERLELLRIAAELKGDALR